VQVQIVELPFPDLNARSNQAGALVPLRLTRAGNDAALVESWLATFDPIDSAKTLVLYRRVASVFIRWLEAAERNLRELKTDDLAEWRDQLQGKPATRANRLAICKSLLSYAHETGYAPFNVGKAVRGPKIDLDADARSMSELQVGLMIQAAAVRVRVERARPRPRVDGHANPRKSGEVHR
jgi:site-specific recombinase XerD